jgi:hypothetical protein
MIIPLKKGVSKYIDFYGDKIKIDYLTGAQEQYLLEEQYKNLNYPELANFKLASMTVKYAIKEWEGLKDEDGKDIKIELVNNELPDNIFQSLLKNQSLLFELAQEIMKALDFSEEDKKKYYFAESRAAKALSQGEKKNIQ